MVNFLKVTYLYLRSFVLKFYETKSHFQNVQAGGFRDEISESASTYQRIQKRDNQYID